MARLKRSAALLEILEFFREEGRVLTRSEYSALGDNAPVPHRLFSRYFNGKSYHSVLKTAQRQFPSEWGVIGSKPEPAPAPAPAPKPVKVKKPAKEPEINPLEALKKAKGESSE